MVIKQTFEVVILMGVEIPPTTEMVENILEATYTVPTIMTLSLLNTTDAHVVKMT